MSEMNMRPSKPGHHHNVAMAHQALAMEVKEDMVIVLLTGPTLMEVIVAAMVATIILQHPQPP
jgi:hypothetical protein